MSCHKQQQCSLTLQTWLNQSCLIGRVACASLKCSYCMCFHTWQCTFQVDYPKICQAKWIFCIAKASSHNCNFLLCAFGFCSIILIFKYYKLTCALCMSTSWQVWARPDNSHTSRHWRYESPLRPHHLRKFWHNAHECSMIVDHQTRQTLWG